MPINRTGARMRWHRSSICRVRRVVKLTASPVPKFAIASKKVSHECHSSGWKAEWMSTKHNPNDAKR